MSKDHGHQFDHHCLMCFMQINWRIVECLPNKGLHLHSYDPYPDLCAFVSWEGCDLDAYAAKALEIDYDYMRSLN
jgi:hypothetical protein